jgi:Cys-rich protein (TIGR01571 family)
MGRIDENPTPVNYQEQQEVEMHHQAREDDDDVDYEPVNTQQYGQQQQPEKHNPPQNLRPQSYPPPSRHDYGNYSQPPPHGQYQSSFPPKSAVQFPPQAPPPNYSPYHQPPPHNIHAQPSPAPAMGVAQYQQFTEGWTTGLFDCFEDPTNALVTACFPCVTFGQIAEILDNGQTPCATSGMLYGVIAFCIAVPCIMSCTYRTKIRSRFSLIESPAPDWITHCFCEWCALCQEYRELQHRGLDPAIGWQGNLVKNQQVATNPPINQTMRG